MTKAPTLVEFLASLTDWPARVETLLVGVLPRDVRRYMHTDLRAACTYSVLAAILTFIPIILRRLGGTDGQLALYYAISALGLLTTGLSMWLSRRLGMMRVAVASWIVGRGSFFLTALASTPAGLLAILAVFWLLESWPSPAYVHTLQAIYPASQRGRIIALVRVGLVAVILLFTPLAGWILDRFGYRLLLPLAGLSGIGATLIFYPVMRGVPEPAAAPTSRGAAPWQPLRTDRRLLFYLAGSLLFGLGILISAPLFPSVQVDRLNLSYTAVGLLGFVQSLFWLLGYLFGGRLLDQLGGIRCLQFVCLVNAVVMLPYIVASQGWMLLPAFAAAGVVAAGADLTTLYTLMELAGPERASEYTALNSTFAGVRGILGPFLGPLLVQAGWPLGSIFLLCAALSVAGAGTLIFIPRRQAQAPAAAEGLRAGGDGRAD